jgi:hypothetical protein
MWPISIQALCPSTLPIGLSDGDHRGNAVEVPPHTIEDARLHGSLGARGGAASRAESQHLAVSRCCAGGAAAALTPEVLWTRPVVPATQARPFAPVRAQRSRRTRAAVPLATPFRSVSPDLEPPPH